MGYEINYSIKIDEKEHFYFNHACYSDMPNTKMDEISFYIKPKISKERSHFYSMGLKNILKFLEEIKLVTGEIKYNGLLKAPFNEEMIKKSINYRPFDTYKCIIDHDFYHFSLDVSKFYNRKHILFAASVFRITFEQEHSYLLEMFNKISTFSLHHGIELNAIEKLFLAGIYSKNPSGPHSIFYYPPSWSVLLDDVFLKKMATQKIFESNLKNEKVLVERKLHSDYESNFEKKAFEEMFNDSINLLSMYNKQMLKEDKNKIKNLIIESLKGFRHEE